ncbi:ENHANCER OF AG-4 protein 2-like [Arachis duranensis]|uniref:ENHANCER OF AG-4 protein 2-like n=1 Tax=Arachis duranensis TaxID=130453 RepID=A0A6P5MRG2_ARADU|nr:ENHANCER OF AG-4 protein 2-like [Arachis duranensis]
MPSRYILAPPTSTQMDHSKKIQFPYWISKVLLMILTLFVRVEEAASTNDRFCISDCDTCPLICSPPPPTPLISISASYPPPPSPHSPPSPLPPLKPNYKPPLSGSTTEAQPTVISGPHDYYYPYYYFYSSCSSSLSNHHAPFFILLLFLVGYFSLVGK